MRAARRVSRLILASAMLAGFPLAKPAHAEMTDMPVVKLQSLDKVAARTMTFEVRVGSTVRFGPIFIKVQACRKAPPIEKPESAAFLQIWEVTPKSESKWIYSGWMFASSPALSAMDHPIYDVWVLDCLERKSTDPVPAKPVATMDDLFTWMFENSGEPDAAVENPADASSATIDMPTITMPSDDAAPSQLKPGEMPPASPDNDPPPQVTMPATPPDPGQDQ